MLSLMEVRARKLGLLGLDALVFTAREKAKQNDLFDTLPLQTRPRPWAPRRGSDGKGSSSEPSGARMSQAVSYWVSATRSPTVLSLPADTVGGAGEDRQHTMAKMETLTPLQHMVLRQVQLRCAGLGPFPSHFIIIIISPRAA